jgi:hypothetical protein
MYGNAKSFVCLEGYITGYLPHTGVYSYQYNMKEERKFAMSCYD